MGLTSFFPKLIPTLGSIKMPTTKVVLSQTQSKNAKSILSQLSGEDPASRLERRIGLRREEVDAFVRIDNERAAMGALKLPQKGKGRQRAQDIFGIPSVADASSSRKASKASHPPLPAFTSIFAPRRETVSLHPLLTPNLHFEQRNTGNCYMLAALYSALQSPQGRAKLLASTVEKQTAHDGAVSYHFQFPTGLTAEIQGAELGQTKSGKNPAKAPWLIQAMELAYAKGVRNYRNQQRLIPYPNGGAGHTFKLVGGGHSASALLDMVGGEKVSYSLKQGGRAAEFLANIEKDKDHAYILTVGTSSVHNGSDKPIAYTLKSGKTVHLPLKHAYALVPNANSRTVTIIDPHDTKNKRYLLDYDALPQLFQSIEGVKLPKTLGAGQP